MDNRLRTFLEEEESLEQICNTIIIKGTFHVNSPPNKRNGKSFSLRKF